MNLNSSSKAACQIKDASLALTVLVATGIGLGVMAYGRWWQENRLIDTYQSRLTQSIDEYKQLIATDNPSAREIYVRGAEIDVITRRIEKKVGGDKEKWERLQFLIQHVNRLETAFSETEHWNEPRKLTSDLGDVKRRIKGYRTRLDRILEDLSESDSSYGLLSRLKQINHVLINSGRSRDGGQIDILKRQLSRTLDLLERFSSSISDADPYDPEVTKHFFSLGLPTALWLSDQVGEPELLEKVEQEVSRCVDSIADPSGALHAAVQDLETISVTVRLSNALRMEKNASTIESDPTVQNAFQQFDRSYRLRPVKNSGVMNQVMELKYLAIKAEWQQISDRLITLQSKDLSSAVRLNQNEVKFLREQTTETIWLCLTSEAWLGRQESKLKIENGVKLAFNLGYGSNETQRGLLAIGNARSHAFTENETEAIFPHLPSVDPRLIDAATVSPSSPWSLTTAAVAAAIDDDPKRLMDIVDNASMLNVELTDSLVRLSLWRAFTKKDHSVSETNVWLSMLQLLLAPDDASSDYSDPKSKIQDRRMGNLLLARAAWQSIAGDPDSATVSLDMAFPIVGETPVYFQIEELLRGQIVNLQPSN